MPKWAEPGAMRKRLHFQSPTNGQDTSGAPTTSWATYYTCWGSIEVLRSAMQYDPAQFVAETFYTVVIRYPGASISISPQDKIVCGSEAYQIQTVMDIQKLHRQVQLLVYQLNQAEGGVAGQMDDVEVTIEGWENMEHKLQEMGPALAREALVDALQQAGDILKEALEANAPIGSPPHDPHPGALAGSIEMVTVLEILSDAGIIWIGPDKRAYWGAFAEFGTVHEPAKPWMRPAFDMVKQQAVDKFIEVMERHLPDVVEKL